MRKMNWKKTFRVTWMTFQESLPLSIVNCCWSWKPMTSFDQLLTHWEVMKDNHFSQWPVLALRHFKINAPEIRIGSRNLWLSFKHDGSTSNYVSYPFITPWHFTRKIQKFSYKTNENFTFLNALILKFLWIFSILLVYLLLFSSGIVFYKK